MDENASDSRSETPSVVYATLVTLSGGHDGSDHSGSHLGHRLIAVPRHMDLSGHDMVALANLNHNHHDLHGTSYDGEGPLQTIELYQQIENGETTSHITVMPLTVMKEQENIEPPVPKGPYTCQTCQKIFPKWQQLRRHMKAHDDDKPYRCSQCIASFNVQDNLTLHEAIHKIPCVCPECDKKFSRVASLKAHIMLHEHEESLMCTECGDEFGVHSALERHMLEHREEEDGIYGCRHCKLEFPSMSALREHMKAHVKIRHTLSHRKYKRHHDRSHFHHKCQFCSKRFAKPSQLQRHMRIHTGERPFQCDTCKKTFNQKGALQLHERTHDENRPFKCDLCPQRFSQKGNLRAHVARAHNNVDNTFQCTECSCSFKKLGALNAHISRMHTGSKLVQVPESSQVQVERSSQQPSAVETAIQKILSEASAKDSLSKDLQESVEQFAADGNLNSDILAQALANSGLNSMSENSELLKERLASAVSLSCPVKFGGSSIDGETLTRVILSDSANGLRKTMHSVRKIGGVRWHQCHYCTKEFKKPSDLVRHIRTHTHEKPYKCTQCYRSFTVRSTLNAHMRTHSGVKGYKCDICEKLFSTLGSLKIHMRLHTGSKPFECHLCDKKFRTSGHLKSHQLSHYKDGDGRPKRLLRRSNKQDLAVPDIPLQEPIVITDSGLVQQPSRHSQLYQQLIGESSGERPYKCNFCAHAFKKSSHLKQHVRSHTGEKPYKCLQCQRSFVSSGVLKAHMKTHTGLKSYKCIICDSTFTTNGSLKRHLSTHSEIRPYMCPYCQKTFKTSVNCKKHMKTHRHELAVALQQQDGMSDSESNLQALQTPQQQRQARQANEQHANSLSANTQFHMSGGGVEIDEQNRNDNLLSEGQFSLTTTQMIGGHNLAYVDGQSLTQNFIGSNQQSLNQLNYGQPFSLDLNALGGSMVSTNMSNILQTRDRHNDASKLGEGQVQGLTRNIVIQEDLIEDEPEVEDDVAEEQPQQILKTVEVSKTHDCSFCEKTFRKAGHLKDHVRIHMKDRPFKCEFCEKCFSSSHQLKSHLKIHSSMREFQCELCNRMFTTQGSLTRHMVQHTTYKPFKCNECNQLFKSDYLLQRHLKEHVDQQEQMTSAIDQASLPQAVVDVNGANSRSRPSRPRVVLPDDLYGSSSKGNTAEISVSEKVYQESTEELSRISEVMDREKLNEELSRQPKHQHQCQQCPRSFKKPSDLVRHIRIHTGEKPFNCDKCGKSFTVKSTLISHLKTHEGHDKVYKCHVCQSPFATKGTLKVHMRLHTGAKPFKCPHCDTKFRTSGHRKAHIQSHFKPLSERRGRKPLVKTIQTTLRINSDTQQQLISLDPSLLQNANLLPISLTMGADQVIQLTDGNLGGGMIPTLEGLQLQLTNTMGGQPGIQITGLDPTMLSQHLHIDAGLLAQLQQQGNLTMTFNPSMVVDQQIQVNQPNELLGDRGGVILHSGNRILSSGDRSHSQTVSLTVVTNNNLDQDSEIGQESSVDGSAADNGDIIMDDGDQDEFTLETEQDTVLPDSSLTCQVCHKITKDENDLAEHLLDHDHLAASSRTKRINKCEICQKLFDKPSQLERHLRIHTGEKPFACTMCTKAFNQKSTLVNHMTKHTGEKQFKCPVCTTRFTQKGNMRTHVRRVHPDIHPSILGQEDPSQEESADVDNISQETSHMQNADSMASNAITVNDTEDENHYDLQLYSI